MEEGGETAATSMESEFNDLFVMVADFLDAMPQFRQSLAMCADIRDWPLDGSTVLRRMMKQGLFTRNDVSQILMMMVDCPRMQLMLRNRFREYVVRHQGEERWVEMSEMLIGKLFPEVRMER